MRRALVVALALALIVAAAGCGGDSKTTNAYVDAVNKAQADFAATFDRLTGRITQSSSQQQNRRTLAQLKTAIDKVVADLRAVGPPAKVNRLHARLIAILTRYGEAIDSARTAYLSGDPQRILTAQTDLTTAVTKVSNELNTTIESINKRLRG